jgi:hypothetical protein
MFKGSSAKTPAQYIASLEEPRKSEVKRLDAFIRKAVPGMKPVMHTGMLGYGLIPYVGSNGKLGDWPVISVSSRAQYISLYVCATEGTGYLAEAYKKALPKTSIGKSCIRFKKLEDVDLDVIEDILKKAATWKKAYPDSTAGSPWAKQALLIAKAKARPKGKAKK